MSSARNAPRNGERQRLRGRVSGGAFFVRGRERERVVIPGHAEECVLMGGRGGGGCWRSSLDQEKWFLVASPVFDRACYRGQRSNKVWLRRVRVYVLLQSCLKERRGRESRLVAQREQEDERGASTQQFFPRGQGTGRRFVSDQPHNSSSSAKLPPGDVALSQRDAHRTLFPPFFCTSSSSDPWPAARIAGVVV